MEMARLDDAGGGEIMELKKEIKELENKIKERTNEIEKMINKGNSTSQKIIIPMLGIIILCGGLTVGVLSGYLIRLPHSQTDESVPGKHYGKG